MMIVHRYPSRRAPGLRGFMAPAAMVLFLLMSMAALVTFAALQNSTFTTRATQDYQASRTTVETAESAAENYWNAASPTPAQPFTSSWTSPQYTEGRTSYYFRTDATTKNVIATATTRTNATERTQTSTRPLRARVTGSWRQVNGEVFYGITANAPDTGAGVIETGAWGAAPITTSGGTSYFNGTIVPQAGQQPAWDAYGGNVSNPGSSVRVATYGAVNVTGSYASNIRSRINAYFDKAELQAMWDDFVHSCVANGYDGSTVISATTTYDYWCSEGSVNLAGTGNWMGVRTLMATGDVTFTGNVSTGGGQLHVYTKGNVNFVGAGSSSTLSLGNVFIFAPNGTCTVDRTTGPSLQLAGALACRRVDMVPNSPVVGPRITHVAPQPHSVSDPYGTVVPDTVYYLERPDFLDRWN